MTENHYVRLDADGYVAEAAWCFGKLTVVAGARGAMAPWHPAMRPEDLVGYHYTELGERFQWVPPSHELVERIVEFAIEACERDCNSPEGLTTLSYYFNRVLLEASRWRIAEAAQMLEDMRAVFIEQQDPSLLYGWGNIRHDTPPVYLTCGGIPRWAFVVVRANLLDFDRKDAWEFCRRR